MRDRGTGLAPRVLTVRAARVSRGRKPPARLLPRRDRDAPARRHPTRFRRERVARAPHARRGRAGARGDLRGGGARALRRRAELRGDRPPARLAALAADRRPARLSRIETGRSPWFRRSSTSGAPLEAAVAAHEAAARARGIRIDRGPGDVTRVTADPRALHQILGNLLDNAVKYWNEEARSRQRLVRRRRTALAVADRRSRDRSTAPRPALREILQSRRVPLPGPGRTGLGLAIVKHLAEAMGGRSRRERGRVRHDVSLHGSERARPHSTAARRARSLPPGEPKAE